MWYDVSKFVEQTSVKNNNASRFIFNLYIIVKICNFEPIKKPYKS